MQVFFLFLLRSQIHSHWDWKQAMGQNEILAKHDTSYAHKQAMLSWTEYVKMPIELLHSQDY